MRANALRIAESPGKPAENVMVGDRYNNDIAGALNQPLLITWAVFDMAVGAKLHVGIGYRG